MFWESYSMKGLMNMKNDKYRTYIYWGVTALTVLLLLVAAVRGRIDGDGVGDFQAGKAVGLLCDRVGLGREHRILVP